MSDGTSLWIDCEADELIETAREAGADGDELPARIAVVRQALRDYIDAKGGDSGDGR